MGQSSPPGCLEGAAFVLASRQSGPIELPGLPAGFNRAADINPAGQIVGQFVPFDDSGGWPLPVE